MIDTSPSSLRILAVMIMGVIWFYLLAGYLLDNTDEDDK